MEKEQLETIIGLIAGVELAVVHLANTVADHAGLSREDVARSFEGTAAAIPADQRNSALMQLVLRQISAGIQQSVSAQQLAQGIRETLH